MFTIVIEMHGISRSFDERRVYVNLDLKIEYLVGSI
jgi:ABC-type transporter Mla maintaining outer membrane lipid asymmetry ATPase subunit MlaF